MSQWKTHQHKTTGNIAQTKLIYTANITQYIVLTWSELYKLALIYELMKDHTHRSHSFIINAFSLKLLKDSSKYQWFYLPVHPSVNTWKINELFVKPVICVTQATVTFSLSPWGSTHEPERKGGSQSTECSNVLECLVISSPCWSMTDGHVVRTNQYVTEGFHLRMTERWGEGGSSKLTFYLDCSGQPWYTTVGGMHAPPTAVILSSIQQAPGRELVVCPHLIEGCDKCCPLVHLKLQ